MSSPPWQNSIAMACQAFKDHLLRNVEAAGGDYVKDLEALSEEQLGTSFGGVSRTAFDFTYEVHVINQRIAKRLRGQDPGPYPFEGWVMAPPEFKKKEQAVAETRGSFADVAEAFRAVPLENLEAKIPLANGTETTAIDLVHMAAYHAGYHDAQLNFIQAMSGDGEVHWSQE